MKIQQGVLTKNQDRGASLLLSFLLLAVLVAAFNTGSVKAGEIKSHPLIGKLWSVKENKFVVVNAVKDAVLRSNYIIVGETHDNAGHHIAQAQVMQWFLDENRRINPVFEMLSNDQLGSLQKTALNSSDAFFDKVAWEDSGWPDRSLYKPVFDIVVKQNLPMFAAQVERDVLMGLMEKGEQGLPGDISRYLSGVTLDASAKDFMKQEIIDSHCGMLPEKMVDPMILGQRVRDAVMAKAMILAANNEPAILIAGFGHGRTDFGVPAYIKSREPDASITAIAMMEVVEEITEPVEYAQAWASDGIPFDYVWFSGRIGREDPCEEMRQYMKHHATGA